MLPGVRRDEQGDDHGCRPTSRGRPSCGGRCASDSGRRRPSCSTTRARDCAISPDAVDLPERLSIFGATRISPARIAVLRALAEHRDVHLWLHHPSPALWEAVRAAAPEPGPRRTDIAHRAIRNPLLASLSRDVRELQQLLHGAAAGDEHHPIAAAARHPARPVADGARHRRQPRAGPGRSGRPQHHRARLPRPGAAGRGRPRGRAATARERPDARAARHRDHVPGRRGVRAARRGRVRHGRRTATTPPACCGCGSPTGRCARPTRCSACSASCSSSPPTGSPPPRCSTSPGCPPSAARFGFSRRRPRTAARLDDRAPTRAGVWTASTARRTGSATSSRAPGGPPLDRLLLGVAMEEGESWLGPVLPLDDVDSGDIDLAGRFAEFVDRLDAIVTDCESAAHRAAVGPAARRRGAVARRAAPGVAGGAAARRTRRRRRRRGRHRRRGHPRRRRAAAALAARRPAHPGQLPHRHPHRLHARADAVGAAPGGVPARHGRRRVPAARRRRRRRRPRPRPAHRRARRPQRGPAAVPRRDLRRPGTPRDRLHRRRSAHRRSRCRRASRSASCSTPSTRSCPETARPRARRRAPPVAAVRPAQLRAGRLDVPGPFSFDPDGLAGARATLGERRPVPPLVGATARRRPRRRTSALDDLVRFLQHPIRGVPAAAARDQHLGRRRRPGRRAAGRPRRAAVVGGRRARAAQLPRPGCRPRRASRSNTAAASCRPARSANAVLREVGSTVDALLAACADRARARRRARSTSRYRSTTAARRRHRRRRCAANTRAGGHLLDARARSTGSRPGSRHLALVRADAATRRCRRSPSARPATGVRRAILGGVDPADGARRPERARRPARRGLARAVADGGRQASEAYADRRYRGQDDDDAREAGRRSWESGQFPGENAEPSAPARLRRQGAVRAVRGRAARGRRTAGRTRRTRFGVLARRLWTPLLDRDRGRDR